jgi:predicted ArsR family transcriptional regulator
MPVRPSPAPGIILNLLRCHGPLDVDDLAGRLGMTTVGARNHMNRLREGGFVVAEPLRGARGRPRLRYALTESADELFPKRYEDLVAGLLRALERVEGSSGVEALLHERQKGLAKAYGPRVTGSLARRVSALVKIQRENGYMPDSRSQDGGFVVREWNCPIAAAAKASRAFCESERRLFGTLLGADVRLEGCRAGGAECCTFRVGPPKARRRAGTPG